MSNPFFSNCGPFYISEILKLLDTSSEIKEKHIVKDVVDLFDAEKEYITFFHSKKSVSYTHLTLPTINWV